MAVSLSVTDGLFIQSVDRIVNAPIVFGVFLLYRRRFDPQYNNTGLSIEGQPPIKKGRQPNTFEMTTPIISSSVKSSGGDIAPILPLTSSSGDGLQYLVSQHRIISKLFDDYFSLPLTAFTQRKAVIDALIKLISVHASIEEQLVYPLFRDRLPNGNTISDRNRTDDQINKELLDLLEHMDPQRDGELYDATVKKMQYVENEHLQEEEVWLSALRGLMSASEVARLEQDLVELEKMAPTHPHPLGPSSAFLAKMTHSIVGALDRAADKAMGRPADELHPTQAGTHFQ